MRLIWTPESKLVLEIHEYSLTCELDVTLQNERWYHLAFTGGYKTKMNIYLNGLLMKHVCYQDRGTVTETIVVVDKHPRFRLLSGSAVVIGSSRIHPSGVEDNMFKGSVAEFKIYSEVLTPSQIHEVMFQRSAPLAESAVKGSAHRAISVEQSLMFPCDSTTGPSATTHYASPPINHRRIFPQRTVSLQTDSESKGDHTLAGMVHETGSPNRKHLHFGDAYLSAMLTVAEAKLSYMNLESTGAAELPNDLSSFFMSVMGSIAGIVPDGEEALMHLSNSLSRHFKVLMEEEHVWRSYNEYAIRLEMLGHSIALLLKQPRAEKTSLTEPRSNKRPVVAIVAPVTSKGVHPSRLHHLAIFLSLLPSLYETRSRGYEYRVYIAANENDPVFSNEVLTAAVFDGAFAAAKEKYYKDMESAGTPVESLNFEKIRHKLIVVPSSMVPKRALSALFNIPTLVAYEDGCDYFYIVNDDLQFKSMGWTEALVNPIKNNPVYPGLGVSGGVDISDSITPQIEFPFFHRTHVELFPWCGTNPWVFKNWWEDNWLTDIYLPFDSVFYERSVVVENYVGIESTDTNVIVAVKSADPRYEVTEGRRTPPFYVEEVEKARDRILDMLTHSSHSDVDRTCETRDFNNQESAKYSGIGTYSGVTNTSYCYMPHLRVPTLAAMPIHSHEDALDPCHTGIAEGSSLKKYQYLVHAEEVPHVPYSTMVPCRVTNSSEKEQGLVDYESHRNEIVSVCARFFSASGSPPDGYLDELENKRIEDMSDESYKLWLHCMERIGMGFLFKTKALTSGELCRQTSALGSSNGNGGDTFASCQMSSPLKILILHNHCPLFTRYGSDKRLYHIAETLVGLGHQVAFGGTFKSGLESDDDHNRLRNIGAKLYSPLAEKHDDGTVHIIESAYRHLLQTMRPDFVLMTLWYWNVPPTTDIFYDLTRSLLPSSSRIGVLSDDAHAYREHLLLKAKLAAAKSSIVKGESSIQNEGGADVKQVQRIWASEVVAYQRSDVVVTITDNDKENILKGITTLNFKRSRKDSGNNDNDIDPDKFQVVRYALSPTEIVSDYGVRLRGEGGGVMDGSKRAHLSFVGNGANPTNQAAMRWFFSDIFQSIQTVFPDIKVIIIGADWDYLAEDYPHFKDALVIRGILNQEDMTSALLTSKVFISPIEASTGLNTKNLLALSRGLPMVTTADGSHGLMYDQGAYDENDYPAPFFIAGSAEEFSHTVIRLYSDNTLWRKTALAALRHARSSFSLQSQAHELERALQIAFEKK
eukprot:CAMPEP_0185030072 /NCGR_PEP_ID=MMETSP1103-20130426/16802_1 /TAXON_ID=36769 /ORGANISM="Paraphysomonas bandaiensis, Strain Caron Lab Isolate" /LENGTH=1263 /DNA_ID=CAMNT_0027565045 /DNA_START=279 /DNA_END=4070 /DNA_ORIENTATION=-